MGRSSTPVITNLIWIGHVAFVSKIRLKKSGLKNPAQTFLRP